LAIALGLAACRLGRRVRFYTAAALVTRLEETQKQYQLDRVLGQLDRADLLICDELGYLSFSRAGICCVASGSASVPNKPKVLELLRGEWIGQRANACFLGSPGTGKTHLAIALGLAACRLGRRVRFYTAAALVTRLEETQKQYQLDRVLGQLDRADLLICDELGYLSFSRAGAELLFQVFADRYERRSLLVTSNLAFSDWGQVFQGERMTAALLDRLTHRCHIFEMNGESYRFRESMTIKKGKKGD
jgi:DNA replication protein DnaC